MKKSGGRHSQKFIPLSNADIEGEKILLPGRRPCTCEATKHALISNCLHCGRIVCAQEGSGPCFTCKNLVCTPKEQEVIVRESKASIKLYQKLMNVDSENDSNKVVKNSNDPRLQSALELRNKLLEYDSTVEQRTKVIDDENDFYQVDSKWLSEKQKKYLEKKKAEMDELQDRRKQTFSFDFAGRKIVEDTPVIEFDPEEFLKSDTSIFECQNFSPLDMPDIHPVYKEKRRERDYCPAPPQEEKRLYLRIQDKELQEMSDEGHCLSLHQPHASLLAAGIKIHEGRVWYTSYRGRLWIHAAGKTPTKQEITDIENSYRYNANHCEFPKTYPTGCLLGCVELVDCLPQEEYKIKYPDGMSSSPYVFICENAQQLTIKFPMKGKHRIFKLESNIHHAAKKILGKVHV